jgi:hypothetical protein
MMRLGLQKNLAVISFRSCEQGSIQKMK